MCASFTQTWQVPDKNEAVDFTVPVLYDYFGMLMPAPIQRSKVGYIYFLTRPFKLNTFLHVIKINPFDRLTFSSKSSQKK